MKKSLAEKLTVRIATLIAIILALLLICSYFMVSRLVRNETEHYTKAIVSIYADMVYYETSGMHFPLDPNASESIRFFGDYICSWYRVDYTYIYAPDIENGKGCILGISQNEEKTEKLPIDELIGTSIDKEYSAEERVLWEGKDIYAVCENDSLERGLDTVTVVEDDYGNRVFVGVGISLDDIEKNVRTEFFKVVLILLVVFAVMIGIMYTIIRKKVFRPAKQISGSMTAFIKDGKRTDVRLDESGGDEFAMIASAFNSMTDDIDAYLENIRSLNRDQERRQIEVDIAAKIQKGFLPGEHMCSEMLEVSAMMSPAKDVGGDLYDYTPLGNGRMLVAIADVSGKGLAASMYMAVTLVLVRQFAKMGQSPAEILRSTNNAICEHNSGLLFATAFVGIYDADTKTLTYSNAGHNPPYIVGDRAVTLDGVQNLLLGIFPGEEYTEEKIKLNTGDLLFLYTDGVNEATDADGNFYGIERLESVLNDAAASGRSGLCGAVYESVRGFAGGSEQHDDITMLALTVKDHRELELDVDVSEFSRIKEAILDCDLPRSRKLDLCVAAEECFVNICSYAYEGRSTEGEKIGFSIGYDDGSVTMRFTDGGMRYDPRENLISAEDYDIDLQIGGLGKLIAFTVADKVDYVYHDQKNILTMIKYLKEEKRNDDRADK